MKKIIISLFSFLGFALPSVAKAHCPLCTAGAVAIGLGAYKLGISAESVGIGIGAAAVALGLWMSSIIPKKYIPLQKEIIVIASFASTIWPVIPFMPSAFPLYIAFLGDYGTTIAVNRFLVGSIIGGMLIMIAPFVSAWISRLAGEKRVPFQGMIITILLLVVSILIKEFAL